MLGTGADLAEFAGKAPLRCFKVYLATYQPGSGQGQEAFALLSSHEGPRFWEGHPREQPFVISHVIHVKSFFSIRRKRLIVPKLGGISLVLSFLILPCGLYVMTWAMTEGCVLPSVDVVEEAT